MTERPGITVDPMAIAAKLREKVGAQALEIASLEAAIDSLQDQISDLQAQVRAAYAQIEAPPVLSAPIEGGPA